MVNIVKTLIFSLLLSLISAHTSLKAQGYTLDTIRVDINNDKIIDVLIDDWSSGSTFGGRAITIIDGKSKEEFILNNFRCYCSVLNTIKIPENLLLEANKTFLDTLKNRVLYHKKRDSIDASLKWLISAENHKQYFRNTYSNDFGEHPFFDVILEPSISWESSKPSMPEPYHIEVQGDILQKFSSGYEMDSITDQSKGFLTYYTPSLLGTRRNPLKTLDSLSPVVKNKEYKIFKTAHTVYVQKGNTYRWLFISDSGLTGAPDNFSRWESIGKIELIDHYVIIHQNVPPGGSYNIILINIESQRVARLDGKYEPHYNNGTDEGGMKTFEVIDGRLVFSEYGVQELHKIPLKDLFENLDNYKVD